MVWFIKDENNSKEIRFQLNYLPIEKKLILFGQYRILNNWMSFLIKEYPFLNDNFNDNEFIENILIENYVLLLEKIEEYKKINNVMKDIKMFNIDIGINQNKKSTYLDKCFLKEKCEFFETKDCNENCKALNNNQ